MTDKDNKEVINIGGGGKGKVGSITSFALSCKVVSYYRFKGLFVAALSFHSFLGNDPLIEFMMERTFQRRGMFVFFRMMERLAKISFDRMITRRPKKVYNHFEQFFSFLI